MAGPPEGDPPGGPVERRLDELLSEVRAAPVPDAEGLTERVVRTARWQRGVREALSSLGSLSGAFAEAAVTLLGLRRGRKDDPR